MAMALYHPEMGEKRPDDVLGDASLSHYGKHYFLKTPLELKGRGIENLGKLRAEDLVEKARHKAGWNQYKVTIAAFEKICAAHKIGVEQLLD
jgi:hypothetical protein